MGHSLTPLPPHQYLLTEGTYLLFQVPQSQATPLSFKQHRSYICLQNQCSTHYPYKHNDNVVVEQTNVIQILIGIQNFFKTLQSKNVQAHSIKFQLYLAFKNVEQYSQKTYNYQQTQNEKAVNSQLCVCLNYNKIFKM